MLCKPVYPALTDSETDFAALIACDEHDIQLVAEVSCLYYAADVPHVQRVEGTAL